MKTSFLRAENKSYALLQACLMVAILTCLLSCTKEKNCFVVGVSQCSVDAWREVANAEMMQEASFYNDIKIQIKSVHDDSEQQIRDIEKFIDEKVDLLVISPNESTSLTPIVEKAYSAGIPVILYDRKTNSDKYTAFVGGDNHQIGYVAGSYSLGRLRENGRVALIRGTKGSTADTDRYNGFVDAMKRDNVNHAVIAAEAYANFNRDDAKNAMTSLLADAHSEHPFDIVFAFNDEMAAGVFDAYAHADNQDKPFIIGVDALMSTGGSGTVSYIINEMIDASFIYPTGGNEVIDLARRILLKTGYQRENLLSSEMVNSTNVRVYTMQFNQMMEKQKKVEELNSRIMISSSKFESQQLMTIISTSFAAMLVILIFILGFFVNSRNKLVRKLNEQNSRIQNQVNSLEEQKRQLIELSQKLEETTQAKLSFFTNISHEFKTPLSLISSPIDDLITNKEMPQSAMASLDILKRNSSKLTRLITELLDFRTFEDGKMVVNYSMGDMDGFLREIIKMFSDVIERRNLKFSYDADDVSYDVPFDPIKLEKVFTNLLSNAFNHVDKAGTIRIKLFSTFIGSGRNINLAVFNSGSYIPPENLENIFQRFWTLDANQRGTGIGLALVSSVVDALGGSIKVTSDKNTGTEFTVVIPIVKNLSTDAKIDNKAYVPEFAKLKLATIGEEDNEADIVDEMTREIGKKVVLVIEDNMDMRLHLKNCLSSDYQVIVAKDGTSGLKKAMQFVPDIIISDIMMPGMDGYEVCAAIRSNYATKNLPVILLTACSLEEHKTRGYESGADAYMQKPFNMTTLKVRMSTLLEKSEQISSEINGEWLVGKEQKSRTKESARILNDFRVFVEEHILDDISLDDLAQHLGFSKSKLYRELKEVTEYSPIDLVNLVRLHKAVDLMIREGQNISEAAFNTGFSSSTYFSHTFLKFYHIRPKDYIKNNLPPNKTN